MPPEPVILAFDTSAAHCAAALLSGGRIMASRVEGMALGQAERLVPMLDEVLADAGMTWRDLTALGVGVGPGNFTGTRIAVATARGLALSLSIPAVGVSAFEVMAGQDGSFGDTALVSIPAPRGQVYVCQVRHGALDGAPMMIDPSDPDVAFPARPVYVIGEAVYQIGGRLGCLMQDLTLPREADTIAILAARKLAQGRTTSRPAPLYIRPADAAPPADLPPVILP